MDRADLSMTSLVPLLLMMLHYLVYVLDLCPVHTSHKGAGHPKDLGTDFVLVAALRRWMKIEKNDEQYLW